jgi:hypothetical protein
MKNEDANTKRAAQPSVFEWVLWCGVVALCRCVYICIIYIYIYIYLCMCTCVWAKTLCTVAEEKV